MNQEPTDGIGGAHIIRPSARKSIHSDCHRCQTIPCYRNTMGRYGVKAVQRNNDLDAPSRSPEQGHDEVDNVMSKMVRSASPVPMRASRIGRRNSYDVNECTDDSDVDDILSKSSPPAFSLYSDEWYSSANPIHQNSRNISTSSQQSSPSSQQSSPEQQQRMNNSNKQNQSYTQTNQNSMRREESSFSQLMLQIITVCLVACIAVCYINYFPHETTKVNVVYDKLSFYNDVMDLGEKYKVKDTSILQVRTGVATIFEKQDTGSFILAYNSKSNNFNSVKFNSFVEDLAATASRYLRNDSAIASHVVVDTLNLKARTQKEFMNTYEEGVAKTGVMLVKDVDNIPSELAMAFHYYCDEYSPLVRRSAIFFTLNLAKCSNNSDPKSTHDLIEKCLAKKWKDIDADRIGPLLTRVVNIVVDVTSVI